MPRLVSFTYRCELSVILTPVAGPASELPPRIRVRGGRKKKERFERWATQNPELAAAQVAARWEALGLAPPSAIPRVSKVLSPAADHSEAVSSASPDGPVVAPPTLSSDTETAMDLPRLKRPRGGRQVRIRVQRAIARDATRAAAAAAAADNA